MAGVFRREARGRVRDEARDKVILDAGVLIAIDRGDEGARVFSLGSRTG